MKILWYVRKQILTSDSTHMKIYGMYAIVNRLQTHIQKGWSQPWIRMIVKYASYELPWIMLKNVTCRTWDAASALTTRIFIQLKCFENIKVTSRTQNCLDNKRSAWCSKLCQLKQCVWIQDFECEEIEFVGRILLRRDENFIIKVSMLICMLHLL